MSPFSRKRRNRGKSAPRSRMEAELREEIESYLDLRTEELQSEGRTFGEARQMAEEAFGKPDEIVTECLVAGPTVSRRRYTEHLRLFAQLAQQTIRAACKRPLFSATAAITLALGIGANAAIFSVVNSVLLEPPDYQDSASLITVSTAWENHPDASRRDAMAPPDVADLLDLSPSIASLVGYQPMSVTLTGLGNPELLSAVRLSEGMLNVFRLRPHLGRDILASEHGYGAPRVAVISHSFWAGQFGMAMDAIGRRLELNDVSYEVIGVAPEGFEYPGRTSVWIPHRFNSPEGLNRKSHTWETIGRLADGATVGAAQAEIDAIASSLSRTYPDSNAEKGFLVETLHNRIVGDVRSELWILLGTVGVVLLIACANVTNMLLIRASERAGEAAVRFALGASRLRLSIQMLTESGVLAVAGGCLGVLLAFGGVELFKLTSSGAIPRADEVAIDGHVLLFTLGIVVVVTLMAGLGPTLLVLRGSLPANLTHTARGSDSHKFGHHMRRLLLGVEVALSVVLLAGAGLLLRTLQQLHAVDLGFETRGIVRFSLYHGGEREEVRTFYRTLERNITALPGVEAVGSIYGAPLGPAHTTAEVNLVDEPPPAPGRETYAGIRAVSPGYLEAARVPLVRGRGLTQRDDVDPQTVAVVNETFVRENFPAEEPLGRRVQMMTDFGNGMPTWTIVGVVEDIRSESLRRSPVAEIYVPHGKVGTGFMTVTVRGSDEAEALVPAIRAEVLALEPRMPLRGVGTIEDSIRQEMAPTRFGLLIGTLFASLALVLAAVGLYGVLGYLVSQRTREIGVRVALGACADSIVRMVVYEGLRIVLIGAVLGCMIALVSGGLLEALLFSVSPWDPWTFVFALAVLFAAALAAMVIPARRASRVDPIDALRAE